MPSKIKKTTYSFIIILIIAILILPAIIGSWIKHEYDALIAFYNSQTGVHIEVTKYERHWFSANAELAVSINPSWVNQLSQSLTAQGVAFPDTINFKVRQHIQNGPILYRKSSDQSIAVQLAYMYSEIEFSPALGQVIELINKFQPPIVIVDNLSFNGKFQRIFRSAGFRLTLPGIANKIELRGINAAISIWPTSRRIKANINTDDFLLVTDNYKFAIPQLHLMCDRTQSEHKLWVGSSSISVAQIYLRDSENNTLTMINTKSNGELSESGEMLNGTRDLSIAKMETGNQVIGPINLRISTHNFDASMSAKIFSTYGPMLFSDQYMVAAAQLLSSLPEVVNGQSSINIEELSITTPNGQLSLNGKIDWPGLNTGSRLMEVVQHTHAEALLRVAIPLANRLSQAMVDLTYANEPTVAPPKNISDKKISAAERQNELIIAMLMESHQLSANAGADLLTQQKKQASLDDYQLILDSLVTSKQITAAVAETLRLKYAAIQWVEMDPDQRKENAAKMLQKQITGWVKEGYITQDKTDYVSRLLFQNGQVSVNGKVVQRAY
ncbi:MAG: DUF945 family protein [Pseudomonadota bacterium]